jgi:hypothetical protein
MRKQDKYSQKRAFLNKEFSLPKTKIRIRNVAARLQHRRIGM